MVRSCVIMSEEPNTQQMEVTDSEEARLLTALQSGSSMDRLEECFQEGYLLWAKIKGYSYWPAVVTVDPMDGLTVKFSKSGSKLTSRTHVHFLGYDNQRAWVPESGLMPFRGLEEYEALSASCPPSKKKDFFPSKRFEALFTKAADLAESMLAVNRQERLKQLGFIYVLIDEANQVTQTKMRRRSTSTKWESPQAAKRRRSSSSSAAATPSLASAASTGQVACENGKGPLCSSDLQVDHIQMMKPLSARPFVPKLRILVPQRPSVMKDVHQDVYEFVDSGDEDEAVPENQKDSLDEASGGNSEHHRKFSPNLGSLLWARMTGFPYWPCFVSRSSDGHFMRRSGSKVEYHCQFFNWNDESAWVSKILPWCSISELRRISDSSNGPAERFGPRWRQAVKLAGKTSHLSRKQRYHLLYVCPSTESGCTVRSLASRKVHRREPPQNPDKSPRSPSRVGQTRQADNDEEPDSEEDEGTAAEQTNTEDDEEDRLSVDVEDLPTGWSVKKWGVKGREYQSPDGRVFRALNKAVAHLFSQNGRPPSGRSRAYSTSCLDLHPISQKDVGWFLDSSEEMRSRLEPMLPTLAGNLDGRVSYFRDSSLPANWTVLSTASADHTSRKLVFKSDKDNRFESRLCVASFLEGMGHPAVELEQILCHFVYRQPLPRHLATTITTATTTTTDKADKVVSRFPSINLNDWLVHQVQQNPVLGKATVPCYIDLVKLPDVFLRHPVVRVSESDNEMLITNITSGEFIAKKIIYD